MSIIEPGSLDIETVNVRIGGIITNDKVRTYEGNKFVVVEEFADVEGHPINQVRFDVSIMCYTLFISPEDSIVGRHRNVLMYHDTTAMIGRIVGGGSLQVENDDKVWFDNSSGDYGSEPQIVRQRLAELLLPALKISLQQDNLYLKSVSTYPEDTHSYWLRYQQVYSELMQHYDKEGKAAAFQQKLEQFQDEEAQMDEYYTRNEGSSQK